MKTLSPTKIRIALGAILAVALVGCGQIQDSFEEGFDETYVEQFVEGCRPGLVGAGTSEEMADGICTCGAERAIENHTPTELMSPTEEMMAPIMEACVNELTDANGNYIGSK